MARRTTANTRVDRLEPALIDEIERAVRQAKALPLSRLLRLRLTPEVRNDLERLLQQRGLERGPKAMRLPLETQLLDAVRGGARVALKDMSKRIKGASKKEIDAALGRLLRAGTVQLVVRTQVEVLVGGDEHTLDREEVSALKRLSDQLAKTLRKVVAKGRPRSMLREDLAALLGPFAVSPHSAGAQGHAERGTGAAENAAGLVQDALRRLEDPALKLIRIADLVRSLDSRLPLAQVHEALLRAAEGGMIELIPEAGSEFLKPEDAKLCPPGPRETVFSYARRLC